MDSGNYVIVHEDENDDVQYLGIDFDYVGGLPFWTDSFSEANFFTSKREYEEMLKSSDLKHTSSLGGMKLKVMKIDFVQQGDPVEIN